MVLIVNIDFDEAQKAWRSNKIYIDNGSFVYITKKTKKKQIDTYVDKGKSNQCKYNLRSSNNSTNLTYNNDIPIHNYNLRSNNLE